MCNSLWNFCISGFYQMTSSKGEEVLQFYLLIVKIIKDSICFSSSCLRSGYFVDLSSTKLTMETLYLNRFRLESIRFCQLWFNMAVKTRFTYETRFCTSQSYVFIGWNVQTRIILQNSFWLTLISRLLEVIIMNNSCDRARTRKFYERLSYIFILQDFVLLSGWDISKGYLQLFPIIWEGLGWIKTSFSM